MTVKGINCTLAVLMTIKSIISKVTVSGLPMRVWRSSMALMPRGVAALPIPQDIGQQVQGDAGDGRVAVREVGKQQRNGRPEEVGHFIDNAAILQNFC